MPSQQDRQISFTYGDLTDAEKSVLKIEPHEWDNKTPSEQLNYCLALLCAMASKRAVEAVNNGS